MLETGRCRAFCFIDSSAVGDLAVPMRSGRTSAMSMNSPAFIISNLGGTGGIAGSTRMLQPSLYKMLAVAGVKGSPTVAKSRTP